MLPGPALMGERPSELFFVAFDVERVDIEKVGKHSAEVLFELEQGAQGSPQLDSLL
jgi:hypothetical protein